MCDELAVLIRGRSQPLHFGGAEYMFLVGLKNQPNFFLIFYFYCSSSLLRGVILADYLRFVLSKENAA